MPLVTAANVPYQPYPSERPAETAGADYQRIEGVSPEAFGAGVGRAQSQLGQTFEKAAAGLEEAAIERQRLTNQVAANDSTNFVMDETTKLLHGDPNKPGDVGYYGLKGVAAINARQNTVENLDKQITAARSRLSNPRQLLMFDNETRRMRNYWMGEIGRHYDQQLTQSAIGTAQAQGKLAENMTAQTAANNDMNGFSLGVENQMKAAIDEGRARGWTQPQIDEKFALIRAGAVSTWVQSMVEKNPTQARDFLEANKDALVAGEYHRLQGLVRARADKATVDGYVFSSGKPSGNVMVRGGAIQGRIVAAAQQHSNIDTELPLTTASIESRLGQAADRPGSQYQGVFQMGRDERAEMGGGEVEHGVAFLANRKSQLAQALGREPANWEVYLAHQQGVAGATALLNNPDKPAGQVVKAANISNNAGNPNAPASAFTRKWQAIYQQKASEITGLPATATTEPQVTTAAAPDVVINNRPLPQREAAELPDASIPGGMFPGGLTLTQKLQQLARDMPNNDEHDRELFISAVKAARSYANGEYAAQQHVHRQQQEADKANDQALMTEYQQRYAKGNYPTSNEILADKRWKDPTAARTMADWIERKEKADPAAPISKKNMQALYTRMSLPEGMQGRLSDEKDINDAYIRGDLTEPDHNKLLHMFRDMRSAGGETLAKLRAEFIRNVAEPQIKGPESRFDNLWGERLWQYQTKLDADIERYKKEGKSPFDLFDPDKPDYVGRDNFLGYYRSKMFSSLRDAPDAALPTQPLDLSTRDKVKEAYGAHKLTWDQAAEALQKLGHPMRSEPAAGPQVPVR